ncbi:outer membrane protein assembly factor BamB family protein [Catenuloplanes japonicus]|uniref:outer membrane protein assembly factor BamB family protein n=1 Tax=Catenuloplanes japonicus TaxID=33876 RepID=UPI000527A005|nr:PQQ-binding-like beta-propeller repeat protein [Catenuloplanes japonicus]
MTQVSRRTLLAGAAGVAVVGLTPGAARAATEGWWPTPGYTAGNSGFSQHETSIVLSTVGRVTEKTSVRPGSTQIGAPVLAGGRIFAADQRGIFAFSESTGEQLWAYAYATPPTYNTVVRLAFRDNVLIAGWDNIPGAPNGSYVSLVTLSAATGAQIAEVAPISYGAIQDITVDRGFVALTLWSGQRGFFTEVLRQSDLGKVWEDVSHATAAPVVANGRLLLRSTRQHRTQVRDLATGAVVASVDGPEYAALAADDTGTRFYTAWNAGVQIVDASTGAATPLASNIAAQHVTMTSTRAYAAWSSGITHGVSAFDVTTARPVFWTRSFSAAPLKPIIAGGVLYVTVPGDRVHVLNPVDGTSIATLAFTGVTAAPVITNGRIYLTDGSRIAVYGL